MKGVIIMHITNILNLITDICIYYYIEYYKRILGKKLNISDNIRNVLMKNIYWGYINAFHTSFVYDIQIMEFPYDKHCTLNEDDICIDGMKKVIDEYIETHRRYYNHSPHVLSMSNHPIENFMHFDHRWIKNSLDVYLF